MNKNKTPFDTVLERENGYRRFINKFNGTKSITVSGLSTRKTLAQSYTGNTYQHQFFVFLFDYGPVEKPRAGMANVLGGGKVIAPATHAFVTSSAKPQTGDGHAL
jgi:hypothetical protein